MHPGASKDLDEALGWYAGQNVDQVILLEDRVYAAVKRACQMPQACAPYRRIAGVRQAFVNDFPYTVFFTEEPNRILILAIAHHRRKPGYWRNRLPIWPASLNEGGA